MQTHHALVYIAPSLEESVLPDSVRKQTADIQHVIVDRFGIADARALMLQAQQTAVEAAGRTFVLATKNIPVEAQNALLKLFEEPPRGVQFHVVIPQEGLLIPTLRSRVQIVSDELTSLGDQTNFNDFLKSSYADRLALIVDITKQKDVSHIEEIISGAEKYLAENIRTQGTLATSIMLVREYVMTPGASKKMLLEELALSLPIA